MLLLQPAHRIILATSLMLAGAVGLSACGQRGPLYIPKTPAAHQRATLPQIMLGHTHAPAPPASAAASAASAASAAAPASAPASTPASAATP